MKLQPRLPLLLACIAATAAASTDQAWQVTRRLRCMPQAQLCWQSYSSAAHTGRRYGMLDPTTASDTGLPLTCRAVFIVGPDKVLARWLLPLLPLLLSLSCATT